MVEVVFIPHHFMEAVGTYNWTPADFTRQHISVAKETIYF